MAEGVDDGVEGVGVEGLGEICWETVVLVIISVLGVIDDEVCPEALDELDVSGAAYADDEALWSNNPASHLHGHGADAAAGSVDEHAVARLEASLDDLLVGSHPREEAASCVGEGGLRGLVDGEAGGQGDVFGEGAGASWEGVAGGDHGDDFVAFAETSASSSSSSSIGLDSRMRVPDVLDGAGEVHLGNAGLVAQEGWDEGHLEDGAGVEGCEGYFDEDPFFLF